MSAQRTTEVHRVIEQIALHRLDTGMYDFADSREATPAEAKAHASLLRASIRDVHHNRGIKYFAGPDEPRTLALEFAAIEYAILSQEWTACPHRSISDLRHPPTTDHTLVVYASGRINCATCAAVEAPELQEALAADSTCDICGADHGVVYETTITAGALLFRIAPGPCCCSLFRYDRPGTRKVRRNDPCPCGSRRKFKRCCGEGGAPR